MMGVPSTFLMALGSVVALAAMLDPSNARQIGESGRSRRDSASLYDNIYSALAEFNNNVDDPVAEESQISAQKRSFGSQQLPRVGRQVADPGNVVLDGFPQGLPDGTPKGVRIALASAQDLPPGEMPPIPGQAGIDYPTFTSVPLTGFDCSAQTFPGIYSDSGAECQVFHMCQPNGQMDSFLCPNGTVFNQQYFICDWWYNVDCSSVQNFYGLNEFIYQDLPAGGRNDQGATAFGSLGGSNNFGSSSNNNNNFGGSSNNNNFGNNGGFVDNNAIGSSGSFGGNNNNAQRPLTTYSG